MHHVSQVLTTSSQKPQAALDETTGEAEKELVNYVFHKIRMTWGVAKYRATFSDEKTLTLSKRDWAKDLLTALNARQGGRETRDEFVFRMKSKVDRVFEEIRLMADERNADWDWPNLKKIAGHIAKFRVHAAHKQFRADRTLEDKGAMERAQVANKREMAKISEIFKTMKHSTPQESDDEHSATV